LNSIVIVAVIFSLCIINSNSVRINTNVDFDREMVVTPRGYLPKECVHEVQSGSHAAKQSDGSVRVIQPDETIVYIPPCDFKVTRNPRQAGDSGWIAYGLYYGTSFSSFNGSWLVPKNPTTTADNQTLFMFTGLEDGEGDEIIQPVIQFGPSYAGGAQYWAVANWWVTSSGQALYSTLVKIKPADKIYGSMVQKGDNSGVWTISALVNNKQPSSLVVENIAPQAMASCTLEVYGVNACTDYPSDGSITFTGLSLADEGSIVKPTWSPEVTETDCNQGVTSSDPTTVTITF